MTDQVRFHVRVTPRGGADRIVGVADGILRVRVAAPPVDDAANRSLVRLLARDLDVPRSSVAIAAGATSRSKRVVIDGVAASAVLARWPGLRL